MDNIKDSQNLDEKGNIGALSIVSIYTLDKSDNSVKDRIERLSAVVYLATNHIKDTDPLKLSVREVCLNCLKTVNDTFSVPFHGNVNSHLSEVLISDLGKIVSYLKVLSMSGFISKNNFEIVDTAVNTILDKSFKKEEIFNHKNEDKFSEKSDSKNPTFPKNKEPKIFPKSTETNDRDNRGEKLLSLIKKQGKVATKDIVDYFPNVSDKTIQRELNKLVNEGKIQRQGKKRWSFYSVV